MKRITPLLLAAGLAAGVAHAQAPDPLQVRSWAASCTACHGTEGRAQPGMAALAGIDAALLTQKLLDYKNGRVPATLMHQIAKGYSDEQLTQIATWFAAQPR